MTSDDDFELTFSSQDRLTKSDASARKQALKKQMEAKGLRADLAKNVDPSKKVDLNALKAQVEGKKDEQTKKDQKQKEQGSKQGTKTREQEIKAAQQTADQEPSAAKLAEQSQKDKKAAEEIQEQEVTGEGG